MNDIGKPERETQRRVIARTCNDLYSCSSGELE
jgi:hypothetical protein